MKRFLIAIILLSIAIGLAFYADIKTKTICTKLKNELIELREIIEERDTEKISEKIKEISINAQNYKKSILFLSDHNLTKEIEKNIKAALEENDLDELKRYCTYSIADCESIIDSCYPYLENIF